MSNEAIEYSLKDMNANFYFTNSDGEARHENVPLEHLILEYKNKWEEVMRKTWFDFLEHCTYFIMSEIDSEFTHSHEFPKEFEPTMDFLVLLIVQKFDEQVLSNHGWYLSDRAGHGYDLGLLQPLSRDWVELFL